MFAIHDIKGNLATPAYSVPVSVDFLKANKNLLMDTGLFATEFMLKLVDSMEGLDEKVSGVLIHSENSQALRLLSHRYRKQVKCIYIDPPYNTASSSIPYKNNYRHSSWAAMTFDRLALLHQTMTLDGAIFVSIDKAERSILDMR